MPRCDMEPCIDTAEYAVRLGSVWGRYCRRHVLEAIDAEYDTRVIVGDPPAEGD